MAHTDLVNIGKTERDSNVTVLKVLFDLVYLAADVSSRSAYIGQKTLFDVIINNLYFLFVHTAIIIRFVRIFY